MHAYCQISFFLVLLQFLLQLRLQSQESHEGAQDTALKTERFWHVQKSKARII